MRRVGRGSGRRWIWDEEDKVRCKGMWVEEGRGRER